MRRAVVPPPLRAVPALLLCLALPPVPAEGGSAPAESAAAGHGAAAAAPTAGLASVAAGTAHTAPVAHEVHELSHREAVVAVGIVFGVIVFAFVGMRIVQRCNVRWVPESGVTIAVGFVFGSIIHAVVPDGVYEDAVRFDERTFTLFVLPPIIFEAGFGLQHAGILKNLGLILTLAVPGTIIAAVFIGGFAYLAARVSYPPLYERPVWEALCLGAILSAIDPVAVISVLGKKFAGGRPNRLYYVIFGESVLNDAVAIVLYKVFRHFLRENTPATPGSIFAAFGTFVYVSLASIAIGWGIAALSALFFKRIDFKDYPAAELLLVIIFGFCSYYLAEALNLSGIMALFLCGRIMGHYTWHNLSLHAKIMLPTLLHSLALFAETYVFAFLGLAFWSFEHDWSPKFTFFVVLILLLARLFTVFPLVGLWNLCAKRPQRLSLRQQFFMWFTGLRPAADRSSGGAAYLKTMTLAARAYFLSNGGGRAYVLTHAPEMPDFWHGVLYTALMADREAFDAIDFCNVQFYNQIPFPDKAHVFTEDVYTPAEKAPTCLRSIAAGIAAASGGKITEDEANSKLMLGFPLKDGSFPVGKENLNQGGAPQYDLVSYGISHGYPLSGVFEWTSDHIGGADIRQWNAGMAAALKGGTR